MSSQLDLFGQPPNEGQQHYERSGLSLRYWPEWAGSDAGTWLLQLRQEVRWKQEQINLFVRTHLLPRLTCWVGNPGCSYTYSGVSNPIEPWTPFLQQLRERVQRATGCEFNSLLLNRYLDGRDKLDWHADDERELDPAAPIASLTLGASRSFRLKPKDSAIDSGGTLVFELGHGDQLVMDPPTQKYWLHHVPPRLLVKKERLNLTFRVIRTEAIRHV